MRLVKVSGIGLFAVLTGLAFVSARVSAADNVVHFTGGMLVQNPCNAEIVGGPGTIDVTVGVNSHTNGQGDPVVNAHVSFHGELPGSLGNTYRVSFTGSEQFNAFSNPYVVPYHSNVIGKGKAPNFRMDGNINVFVNGNGDPVGAFFTGPTMTCQGS